MMMIPIWLMLIADAPKAEDPRLEVAKAIIEQVNAMPGQGVTSMFAFGESFGLAKGVLAGLKIPTSTVTPGKWKKALQLNAGKDGSRAKAAQIWPEHAGEFKRVKDDGKAEACLIAYWGRSVPI